MSHLYMHELLKLFDPSLLKAAFLSAWWFSRCSRSAVQNQSSGVTTLGGWAWLSFQPGGSAGVPDLLCRISAPVYHPWRVGPVVWFRGSRSAVQTQSPCASALGGFGLSGYFWPVEDFFSPGAGPLTGGELCCVERALW